MLFTVKEAAVRLSLSEVTIRTWISLRKINSIKLGKARRISEDELCRIIAEGTQPRRQEDEN